ncbi:MAG: tetratricopeptide repeat protein [Desulfocapsaceae bacterium]|nr:tetratricopeptide repeat protein [Desulfocapsaceae bacterium]
MANPNAQLKEIHEDLKAKFDNHPFIKIIPFDDDPPEKYEVQYSILGLSQDSDGNIKPSREHSVFINIPFGFPHFPPSCTPQTPTFHPDFDQAAICIGEFWNKDRTMPELVMHIGKMICGEVYSTENTFNDAAADWYQKISEELPFEELDFSYSSPPQEDEILAVTDEELELDDIDTLDDNDISGHADYFDSTNKAFSDEEISFPSPPTSSGKSSINRVYLLIRQKRFYELSGFLNELPDEDHFDDRAEIDEKISNLLAKAQKLQKEADEFEHQGNPQLALELFEKVAEIVTDFPGIEENIERTRNSVELASGDWASDDAGATDSALEGKAAEGKTKRRVAFFEESSKKSIRLLPILAGVLAIVLAIVFISPLFTANSRLEKANQLYSQCKSFIDQSHFARAEEQCNQALDTLKKISLYKTSERDALQSEITLTMSSKEMEQGLAGRVFFEGKYVRKSDMSRMVEFNSQKEKGDEFYEKSSWKKAIGQYTAALKTAQPISDSFIDVLRQEVRNKVSVAEINLAIDRGFSLLSRGELEKSKEMFADALQDAEALPEELGGSLISRIEPKLNEIQYLQHLDLGKKYFSANDWESAIQQYEKALQLRDITAVQENMGDTDALYANMAEAELFSLINSARDAFSSSQLDDAIRHYQEAIDLLTQKEDLLERVNPDEIRQQLNRIILRARIVQFKKKADSELENERFAKATASYNRVIEVIRANGYEKDEEFQNIIEGTKETIAETRNKAEIAKRIDYLVENYKDIFEENYSAAVPEYLSEPKATFLRFLENGNELYEIQCLENNRGRKLRLVMLYSYNPSRKTWQFYSENN